MPGFSALADRLAGDASGAWEIHFEALRRRAAGDEVLLLTVGDSDFDCPETARKALSASLAAGRSRYTAILGEWPLRAALAARHARLTGCPTRPQEVAVTAGAQHALFAAAMLLLGPGDEVIVPEPMYVTYPGTIAATGARLVTVPSPAAGGFHFDPQALADAVTERARAVLLATPNNPTGAVYSFEELAAVADICRRRDLWLISDEVYAGLTYDVPHVSAASLPEMAERRVVVSSLSKSHAMPGWRLGWMVAPESLMTHLFRLLLSNTYGLPGFIQDGALAALEAEPEGLGEMKAAYARRRVRVAERLNDIPGLSCPKPEGGMFLMVDVRDSGMGAKAFADGLLAEEAVALLPADAFGPSGAGHLRLNLGTPDSVLDEAVARIAAFTARGLRVTA